MMTVITGFPGVGKTSFIQAVIEELVTRRGDEILESCKAKIDEYNRDRKKPLSYPERVPIFTNIKNSKFHTGYNEDYKPYVLEPDKIGVYSVKFKPQYFPPFSTLVIDEAERYFDSHNWTNLKTETARAFEEHRQHGLNLYLIFHKPPQADISIKNTAEKFIVILKQIHEKDKLDRITTTTWEYAEFDGFERYLEYLNGGKAPNIKTMRYRGDIFETFDSFAFGKEFLPPDDGTDFDT